MSFSEKVKPHVLAFYELWDEWMTQFTFRAFLWYEFWESGMKKLPAGNKSDFFYSVIEHIMDGDSRILRRFLENNWFGTVSMHFPGPLRMLPDDFTWLVVMFVELVFSWFLLFGIWTRGSCAVLFCLSVMAWVAVHSGHGYNVCDDGWKMPLIYLIFLVAIVVQGPSKLSVDRFIAYWWHDAKK